MAFLPFNAAKSPRLAAFLVFFIPVLNVGLALFAVAIGYTMLPGHPLRLDGLFHHFPGLLGVFITVIGDPGSRIGLLSAQLQTYFQNGGEVTVDNVRDFTLKSVVSLALLATMYMLVYVPGVHALVQWFEPQGTFSHWLVDVPAAVLAGLVAHFIPSVSELFKSQASAESELERGTEVVTIPDVHAALEESRLDRPPTGDLLPWGGLNFFESEVEGHFAITGTTGSGKTLTIRMLLQQALLDEDGSLKRRVLMFDAKTDFYPVLRGMGIPAEQIHVLHPFDTRSSAWDVATDLAAPQEAQQFAALLAPLIEGDPHPFFASQAQELLRLVFESFRTTVSSPWGLNDIVETILDEQKLELVLSRTRDGLVKVRSLREARARGDVLETLHGKGVDYMLTARLWARSLNKVSLSRWMSDTTPSVLLLACDSRASQALEPINRLFFSRAVELVLGQPGDGPDHIGTETWFVLDEFAGLGDLGKPISDLLSKGRSKRARVVLGFQDIEGVRDVYGREKSNALVNQCSNFAVFRNTDDETREWASNLFGSKEQFITQTYGETRNLDGSSSSSSESTTLYDRRAIAPSEFLVFPEPTPRDGIFGAFRTKARGWMDTVPPAFVRLFLHDPSKDPSLIPRDPADQEDISWSVELAAELANTNTVPPPGEPPPTQLRSLD